jgi:hypothetical protein
MEMQFIGPGKTIFKVRDMEIVLEGAVSRIWNN